MILKRVNPNIQGKFTNILMDQYGEEIIHPMKSSEEEEIRVRVRDNRDNISVTEVVEKPKANVKYYKYRNDVMFKVEINYQKNRWNV